MPKKPACTQRNIIAKSRLFTVEELHLNFSNGSQRIYERIKSNGDGAVMVIAITDNNSLLLISEYAVGTDSYELSFPKGIIEPGETSLEAANRELREETGFAAKELFWLRSMTLAPGYFGARIEMVVAQGLYYSPLVGDEPEPPIVSEWSLDAADELLERPDFTEARSIAALFLVKEWLNKRK
ncbi:MAG: ADP compounds hydrolase NudE [bacterium]|nr:ADP compounds hydrolase NudE [bacterium]